MQVVFFKLFFINAIINCSVTSHVDDDDDVTTQHVIW